MSKNSKFIFITCLFILLSQISNASQSLNKTETQSISLEQATSFGFIPEIDLQENNYGHITFRITNPENVKNSKIEFASILLFTYGQSITSSRMSEYNSNGKEYFFTQINKLVVDSVTVSVVCIDSNNNRYVYKFKVDLSAL
ncbi:MULTISPECIES: hypothetical protein [unclassified Colwellia]|jgi:hypothetical protein|uniref:hypothetical protein n=1 Tax=unclassified Colwellia TaxID=196834 RepID=UPI0015F65EAF|nr:MULTISPECIES: hypothetical protein [unclassified Colwellia]MBA6231449.1 hypothetical protein [Colwellia sp. MB02u-7]MBA6234523.1 hypothetical protein [Colwellia sp. MB02u-11]MBA6298957.1 hypothetical protein [Colwellia sp. MB3u-22]MBA6309245.1 hypothetical protein [Colwellia sp. MB3u-64]